MFYTIKETRKWRIYTLNNHVKAVGLFYLFFFFLLVFVSLLYPTYLENMHFITTGFITGYFILTIVLIILSVAGNFKLLLDQFRNMFNGNKIIGSGWIPAMFSKKDFSVWIEK